jgi:hypothetical protein
VGRASPGGPGPRALREIAAPSARRARGCLLAALWRGRQAAGTSARQKCTTGRALPCYPVSRPLARLEAESELHMPLEWTGRRAGCAAGAQLEPGPGLKRQDAHQVAEPDTHLLRRVGGHFNDAACRRSL